MVRLQRFAYNSLLIASCLLPALGCGSKPTEPPPGATEENAPPAVDLGAPADPGAHNTPAPDNGTPEAGHGETQP